jgi:membrane protease YdiL (CAAX protease family)
VSRGDLVRISALAAGYALAAATLGSLLLIGCAFACGVAWGTMRLATRSLSAPIAMHIAWDLGVLIAWPLA